jgi:hypothetical protein
MIDGIILRRAYQGRDLYWTGDRWGTRQEAYYYSSLRQCSILLLEGTQALYCDAQGQETLLSL